MTTNVDALDELPTALRDRFPVSIRIDRPHPASVTALSTDLRQLALNGSLGDQDRRMSLRAFFAFDRIRHVHGEERAANLVLGHDRARAFLDALAISNLAP